jgi:5-methyltetrahydropteroyltriglutamate--homocysteine methyltransferase
MPIAPTATPPFRAEVIGSLLRSRRLKDAGRAMQEGRLPAGEYQAILERETARVIARQESAPRDFPTKSGTL